MWCCIEVSTQKKSRPRSVGVERPVLELEGPGSNPGAPRLLSANLPLQDSWWTYQPKYAKMSIETSGSLVGEALVLNESLAKAIDASHRALLRFALGIRWPSTISSRELYQRANLQPATTTLRRSRLQLIGRALRNSGSQRTALSTALTVQPTELFRRGGANRLTYQEIILEDVAALGKSWEEALQLASDMEKWNALLML